MKRKILHLSKGYNLFKSAEKLIAGGSQLFGKRADLYCPGHWPSYYNKAKGCEIIDLYGNKFYDFTMVGTGTSVLGYSNSYVNKAVIKAIKDGNISTLNNKQELILAKKLLKLHPGLGMVRYARSGGEILSIAIRIARAHTKKDKVAICGYHGWHDWYLSANLSDDNNLNNHLLPNLTPNGIPMSMNGLTIPFKFNDPDQLERILSSNLNQFAAIILEPFRDNGPKKGYLEKLRKLANKYNTVLIFDEVTSGFREVCGGMYLKTKVVPDMVTFGKAMSNGIPMSALLGKTKFMKSFDLTFISSTYWGDRSGPAAAIATINFMKSKKINKKINIIGEQIKNILINASRNAGFKIEIIGPNSLLSYKLDVQNWPLSLTFIIKSMLKKGFLFNDRVYANIAHTPIKLKKFENAVSLTFLELKKLISSNKLKRELPNGAKDMGFNKIYK